MIAQFLQGMVAGVVLIVAISLLFAWLGDLDDF